MGHFAASIICVLLGTKLWAMPQPHVVIPVQKPLQKIDSTKNASDSPLNRSQQMDYRVRAGTQIQPLKLRALQRRSNLQLNKIQAPVDLKQ